MVQIKRNKINLRTGYGIGTVFKNKILFACGLKCII